MTIREELVDRLLEHCELMCTTGEEASIADAVERRYREAGLPVERIDNSVVVGGDPDDDRPLVLLVGHLDVVPPTDADREPRRETRDGEEIVVGRGTSDMKAGNVVAMHCLEDEQLRASSPFKMGLVLYGGEEGPAETNELPTVLDRAAWLGGAELAVILEPTDGEVQLGCLGGLHAELTFRGKQAHSARPWHGENALTKAGAFLAELHDTAPNDVDVDGIPYRDVFSATQAHTSNARNVIPGEFVVNLNMRFAPARDLDTAEQELRALVGDRADVEIVDRAPPAPPRRNARLVAAFVDAAGATVAGKQAWTDIARFAERDIPALNFGPGLTAQAHQRGEYVPVSGMVDAHAALVRFLTRADHDE